MGVHCCASATRLFTPPCAYVRVTPQVQKENGEVTYMEAQGIGEGTEERRKTRAAKQISKKKKGRMTRVCTS
jgi:hypothetical protein